MSVVENAKKQLLSSGSWSVERVALALRGQLDRSDYGLVWNRVLETGNLLVGDSVDVAEPSPDGLDHHVLDAELDRRMRGVDRP